MTQQGVRCSSALHSRGQAVDAAVEECGAANGTEAEDAGNPPCHDDLEQSLQDDVAGMTNPACDANYESGAFEDGVNKNVPGSNASDIRIEATWHAMPRQVIRGRTKFGLFLQAMFLKPHRCDGAPLTKPLWPMPLPYHFGKAEPCSDASKMAFRKAISLQVAFLNYLHMNRPNRPPPWICGRRTLTEDQWKVVRRLERLSGDWRSLGTIKADDMGRVAAKQERQETVLKQLSNFAESSVVAVKKYQRLSRPVAQVKRPSSKPVVVGKLLKKVIFLVLKKLWLTELGWKVDLFSILYPL